MSFSFPIAQPWKGLKTVVSVRTFKSSALAPGTSGDLVIPAKLITDACGKLKLRKGGGSL